MTKRKFTVLLSASVPLGKRNPQDRTPYQKIPNAQLQIEEAVIALGRSVFQSGGRIIFGGHPSISPLMAMVATEFVASDEVELNKPARKKEKMISIFQSRAFAEVLPKETSQLFAREDVEIIWTEAIRGEKYDAGRFGEEQCISSLSFMRRLMMDEKIDALVCIGGMEGVQREFHLYQDHFPTKPVYLFESTGGAAQVLSRQEFRRDNVIVVDRIDREESEYIKSFPIKESERFKIIPFPFIAELIIKRILNNLSDEIIE